MNVLIVDDQPIERKLLRLLLQSEGHVVVEAASGIEALQRLEREGVDAVISDVLMPDMDGFRLCHEIRTSETMSVLPFILYTSTYDSPADRQLAQSMGADDYIVKPAPAPVLMQALRDAVQKTRETRSVRAQQQDKTYVLKQYSEALVLKLEERNLELLKALDGLETSRSEVFQLNRDLDSRVQERTAELQIANAKLKAANEELEAFSYSVAHDLRGPLRHINGYTGQLKELLAEKLDAEGHRHLAMVSESVKQMARLIDDLLAFSRRARAEMQNTAVDLESLLDGAIRTLHAETQARNIVWKRNPLPAARGDPAMLSQVFVNLISNAVKYTRCRDPAQIEIGSREESPDELTVFVRDNGVGFDMRHANLLFGVFQRLHRADEFEGIGIGLANVRRIISRHGGRTWAAGTVGAGATFFFTLPYPKTS
jgi:signal transduction histidine kinase